MSTPVIVERYGEPNASWPSLRKAVERLLAGAPPEHLAGLDKVVLRDLSSLTSHEKKKRAGKPGKTLMGTYHRATPGRRAYIEIFANEIAAESSRLALAFPFWADAVVSRVLYHEVGHHIHRAIRPESRDPESAAEEWQRRLRRHYFRKRYGYLRPVLALVGRPLAGFLRWLAKALRTLKA